jgi:hypothetical protein
MPNGPNDHAALVDRVQHSVTTDPRTPDSLEAANQSLARRLGLDGDQAGRFKDCLANGRG